MMNSPFFILFYFLYILIFYVYNSKPNIVFIIVDDLGWADLGFTSNNQILTPNIDHLYNTSVFLNHYYVQNFCSPTRASIMTGRYPIRNGMQDLVIQNACPYGLHLNETVLPQLLKDNGYDTHAVGKWHLGFYTWEHTPTFRGFNSFLGLYTYGGDYYTHMSEVGFDFRYDDRPNCGRNCTKLLHEMEGQYSTEIFSDRAVQIINEHDISKPLFLYLSYQAVHFPAEVPQSYIDIYNDTIKDKERRIYAGMVTCLDYGIGNVTKALKDKGIYDDTLIIFTTDNGGPITEDGCTRCIDAIGANNYPLRAGKQSYYDGGFRGISIISGLNLPHLKWDGLMHSSDWLPTIAHIAGIDIINKTLPLDGYNQWNNIMFNLTSPRTNILHNIEMSNKEGPRGAYRDGNWKIIAGPGGPPYSTKPIPNYEPCQEIKDILKSMNFKVDGPVELYDVINDPYEENNVISENEPLAIELLKKFKVYHTEMFPAYDPFYFDPKAQEAFVNGSWMPWMDN